MRFTVDVLACALSITACGADCTARNRRNDVGRLACGHVNCVENEQATDHAGKKLRSGNVFSLGRLAGTKRATEAARGYAVEKGLTTCRY